MQTNRPQAYIFDVFGTVVDWRTSVAREVTSFFLDHEFDVDGLAFADAWRAEYVPAMAKICSGNRGYVPLDQLHFENLKTVLQNLGMNEKLDDASCWQLSKAWEKLDPWPDVVASLTALKQHAIIAPCSNGSIAMMTRLAKYGALPWDCILGADIAENYKPEPVVYHRCCQALRLEPSQVMMVAAHNNDLEAAQDAGLQTGFIARPTEYGEHQNKDFEATGDWTRVVDSFGDLAAVHG